jgi:DDE domain
VKINGKLCYLWRAVDHEGEVLEAVVTAKRDGVDECAGRPARGGWWKSVTVKSSEPHRPE